MLRNICAEVVRSSSLALCTSRASTSSPLHTSAVLLALTRKQEAKNIREANEEKQSLENRAAHPVLGHYPGDEDKWRNCDLAHVLVTETERTGVSTQTIQTASGKIEVPQLMAYGVGETEKKAIFRDLHDWSLKGGTYDYYKNEQANSIQVDYHTKQEHIKATNLAAVLDIRNANAKGISFENKRRCVALFSPLDATGTGKPEVQAAILTFRIRNLWEHLVRTRQDIGNRRSLRLLVHQRAKILKYLKRKDRRRYDDLLPRLGLEADSVEGELVI